MSGHSHFKTIKHKKEIEDQKRGKIFSKLAKKIAIVAREKGGDPNINSSLRIAIDTARSFNMPNDNIKRAIERGVGGQEGESLQEILCEAFGPGRIAIIIEGITDNKNRTFSEIKQILNKNNGKFADPGSVKWLFEQKGVLQVEGKELPGGKDDLELKAIEAGAEDIEWDEEDNVLSIYTKPGDLERIKEDLRGQGVSVESANLEWVAKDTIKLEEKDKQSAEKLFEILDENDDVQEIYSNMGNL